MANLTRLLQVVASQLDPKSREEIIARERAKSKRLRKQQATFESRRRAEKQRKKALEKIQHEEALKKRLLVKPKPKK